MDTARGAGSPMAPVADAASDDDSDASDTDLGGDDKDFLRKLQRQRERAQDTRPLVRAR